MMMSELPADLVEEILSRVPATSLKRFRSTCKRWNCLFKEPGFTEKHFRKAPKQSHVLALKENRVCSMIIDLNVIPPSIEFKDELNLKDSRSNSEQVDITQVSHCDGLLLCITKDDRYVVWNPCSGETRWIHHEYGYKIIYPRLSLRYENKKSGRNYKILMYLHGCEREGTVCGFEIYEFSSNTWRVFNAPNWVRTIHSGVTLKGNAYWISVDDDKDNYLLSFDFTREIFGRLCLPPAHNRGCYTALSVVGEEKLSVLHYSYGTWSCVCYTMRVSNKLNTEADLSWSKSFEVNFQIISTRIPPSASLLINEEKKVALCCNSHSWTMKNVVYTIGEDHRYYKEILFRKESCLQPMLLIFSYVPSLVRIDPIKLSK